MVVDTHSEFDAQASDIASQIIRPSRGRNLPPVKPIRLHALDLLMYPVYTRFPMVHKLCRARTDMCPEPGLTDAEFYAVVRRLKTSLAEALELFPPVAGTLCTVPVAGGSRSNTMILCDGRGASFMVQTDPRPYVEAEHWLDSLAGRKAFTSKVSEDVASESSTIFAVKVTRFSCGTLVLVTSMHHQVADLTSYMNFLDTWARICRGDSEVEMYHIPKQWSRNLEKISKTTQTIPSTIPGVLILPPAPPSTPILRASLRWFLSDASAKKLKHDCISHLHHSDSSSRPSVKSNSRNVHLHGDPWLSTTDGFTALIWGAMTRARHNSLTPTTKIPLFSPNLPDMEALGVAVDGREHLGQEPGLGLGSSYSYFGNMNLSLAVYARRSDLLEASIEATSRVALAIRTTLRKELTAEAIAQRVAFIEASLDVQTHSVTSESSSQTRVVLEGDCRCTNWSKYDLTKLDFGLGVHAGASAGGEANFHQVYTTTPNKTRYPPGMFVTIKAQGGYIVSTPVEEEADVALGRDPLLCAYAEHIQD